MGALTDFMAHFGISSGGSPRQLLASVVAAFSELPYENITKIIKRAEFGSPEKARRYPEEVIRSHIDWGTGGTCFSLTSALMYLVRSLGWKAEYILADRRYGQNTHCALLVSIDGIPHLLDPGFLITDPIPLPALGELEYQTAFNGLILAPAEGDRSKISLSTVRRGARTYRLTYKTSPVDSIEFFKAWDASFGWDMMKYPLLTRTANSKHIYLKGSRFQISNFGDSHHNSRITEGNIDRPPPLDNSGVMVTVTEILPSEDLICRIAAEFHIHPSVVERGVSVLRERGEIIGKASSR